MDIKRLNERSRNTVELVTELAEDLQRSQAKNEELQTALKGAWDERKELFDSIRYLLRSIEETDGPKPAGYTLLKRKVRDYEG